MSYITSGNVSVFPSALRTGSNGLSNGKYTSEPNLTQILRSITDADSYIISNTEIVIHGYYFKLANAYTSGTWASILVDNTSGRLVSNQATPGTTLDDGTYFLGLAIDTTEPTSSISGVTRYKLQLVDANKLKFTTDSIKVGSTTTKLTDYLDSLIPAEDVGSVTNPIYYDKDEGFKPITSYSGIVAKATQLQNDKTLWGQTFNGTANVSGKISGTGDIIPANNNVSDIGSSDYKYKEIYATTFKGNADTATTATTASKLTSSSYGDTTKTGSSFTTFAISSGEPQNGRTITFSSTEPTSPSDGDIWFVI